MVIAFIRWNPFHHSYMDNSNGENYGGEYNGYVAFDGELPLSYQGAALLEVENPLDDLVYVHGGITYDRPMKISEKTPLIPLTAMPDPETLKKFRVIGFDTLHYGDTKEEWTFEKTKAETLHLKEQIETLLKGNKN